MTTPSPGRGWRWLRVGARIRNGDKCFSVEDILPVTERMIGEKVWAEHTIARRVKKGKL